MKSGWKRRELKEITKWNNNNSEKYSITCQGSVYFAIISQRFPRRAAFCQTRLSLFDINMAEEDDVGKEFG